MTGPLSRDEITARMAAAMVAAVEGDEAGMDLLIDDLGEQEVRSMVRSLLWSQAAMMTVVTTQGQVLTADEFAPVFTAWLRSMRGVILELRTNVDG